MTDFELDDSLPMFDELEDVMDDVVRGVAREQEQRIERAIHGAIRAGYEGVDINRLPQPGEIGIDSIEPWNRPAPDEANGYRTERYTWDWYSDEELELLLTASDLNGLMGHD